MQSEQSSKVSVLDPDLQEQVVKGHGVPSQDPDPSAQIQLSAAEAAREVRSALTGGGMIAGAALGCLMGAIWAGGAGAVLGSVARSVLGVLAALAALAAGVHVDSTGDAVFLHY